MKYLIKIYRVRSGHTRLSAFKPGEKPGEGGRISRTTSRVQSIHESLYANRTSFLKRATRKLGIAKGTTLSVSPFIRSSLTYIYLTY